MKKPNILERQWVQDLEIYCKYKSMYDRANNKFNREWAKTRMDYIRNKWPNKQELLK